MIGRQTLAYKPKRVKSTRPAPNFKPKVYKDRERLPSSRRGYGADWRRVRNIHIDVNPFCIGCEAVGTEVDHIVPVYVDYSLRLVPSNLQTICHSCHVRKTHADIRIYGPPDKWKKQSPSV